MQLKNDACCSEQSSFHTLCIGIVMCALLEVVGVALGVQWSLFRALCSVYNISNK